MEGKGCGLQYCDRVGGIVVDGISGRPRGAMRQAVLVACLWDVLWCLLFSMISEGLMC